MRENARTYAVFLGWSGARSLMVAKALREWLPRCLPGTSAWVSDGDIGAGQGWSQSLEDVLKNCDCGIFCITAENGLAPWLNFEAGAVFVRTPNTLLFPYLFDAGPSSVSAPVSRFQAVQANEQGTRSMIQQIRAAAATDGADPFGETWPLLEERLASIRNEFGSSPKTSYSLSAGTRLNYRDITDDAKQHIIITAQNLQSLIHTGLLSYLKTRVLENRDLRVDIILTVPEFFLALPRLTLDREALMKQFQDTLLRLDAFMKDLEQHPRSRVNVCFHPGVSSLSAMVRDPDDDRNGIIGFVPKWATDLEPDNRVFCLIRKSDNRELFQKMVGHIGMMRNPSNSMMFDEMLGSFRKIPESRSTGWRRWWKS